MSVIFFCAAELAAVAAVAVGNMSSADGRRKLDRYCDALARYSSENAAAWNASYPDRADCNTAAEIRAAVRPQMRVDQYRRAMDTLDLLRYNLIANSGDDFASKETLDALLAMSLDIRRRTMAACYYDKSA